MTRKVLTMENDQLRKEAKERFPKANPDECDHSIQSQNDWAIQRCGPCLDEKIKVFRHWLKSGCDNDGLNQAQCAALLEDFR